MTDPVQPRPQPVLDQARLAGLVAGAFVTVAGLVFWFIDGGFNANTVAQTGHLIELSLTALLALGAYVSSVWHGQRAAQHVTPIANPADSQGRPLVVDPAFYGRHAADPTERPRASYRLGRTPNQGRPRIRLTAGLVTELQPPKSVDWYSKVPAASWGMDGNDTLGDCTCAEIDHAVKTLQVAAGNPEVQSKTAEVVKLYEQAAGYNPADPNTDQGAEMQAIRDYWRRNGVVLGGTKHTIALFAEVDHTDVNLVKWCISRFGELGVGVNFPASAMDQFGKGQPWTVVKGSPIDGGHAVAAVGYDDQWIYLVSWGRVVKASWEWFGAYCEELWTQLSTEWVNAVTGDDPLGETLHALGEQYQAVTGQPNPFPAPTPAPSTWPPQAAYEAWKAHPRSVPKTKALIAAVDSWEAQ